MADKLSKHADNILLKKYIQTVWKSFNGFFENAFSILAYASPFLGVGWLPLAANLYASNVLGVGLSDMGKWIDEKLGISPGQTPTMEQMNQLPALMEKEVLSAKAQYSPTLSKRAGVFSAIFSSIFKSRTLIKLIFMGIKKLIVLLGGVFAVAHLSDLVKEIVAPLRGETEMAPEPPEISEPDVSKKERLQETLEELETKYRGV
jgi:hypothetical protein